MTDFTIYKSAIEKWLSYTPTENRTLKEQLVAPHLVDELVEFAERAHKEALDTLIKGR